MTAPAVEPLAPSVSVEFADLIVEQLKGRTWSAGSIGAVRTWLPTLDLKKNLGVLIASVVPREFKLTPANRIASWYEPVCEFGLLRKPDLKGVESAKQEEFMNREADAHSALLEEIARFFRSPAGRSYRNVGTRGLKVNVTGVEVTTQLQLEHFHSLRQLTGVIRLTGRILMK